MGGGEQANPTTTRMSHKQRIRPKLSRKLHTSVTAARSKPVKVRQINLGQGKRKIWIGAEACAALLRPSNPTTATTIASTNTKATPPNPSPSTTITPTPAVENARNRVMNELRQELVTMCGEDTPPPLLAVERWIFDTALEESTRRRKKKKKDADAGAKTRDPLLQPLMDQPITAYLRDILWYKRDSYPFERSNDFVLRRSQPSIT